MMLPVRGVVFCLLLKVLVVISTDAPVGIYREALATVVKSLSNKVSLGGINKELGDVSTAVCLAECMHGETCSSFFHNKKTGQCQIQDRRWDLTAYPFQNQEGHEYYRLKNDHPIDCYDILMEGKTESGVYTIYPEGIPTTVYCDQDTDGGGWLIFQRRKDGSEDFYRNWNDYEEGFGDITNEFWIGNLLLANLTAQRNYALRVDMENFENETRYAYYGNFAVGDASTKYTLLAEDYNGTAGDSLGAKSGQEFTTKDQDNDSNGAKNCAVKYSGAWWYRACHASNLNGLYHGGTHVSFADGVNWYGFMGYYYSLRRTEMKFRPTWL